MNHALDWSLIMEGYNDRFKTSYTDVKTFLTEIMKERSGQKNIKLLGVGDCTFYNKLRAMGIEKWKRPALLRVRGVVGELKELGRKAENKKESAAYFRAAKLLEEALRWKKEW